MLGKRASKSYQDNDDRIIKNQPNSSKRKKFKKEQLPQVNDNYVIQEQEISLTKKLDFQQTTEKNTYKDLMKLIAKQEDKQLKKEKLYQNQLNKRQQDTAQILQKLSSEEINLTPQQIETDSYEYRFSEENQSKLKQFIEESTQIKKQTSIESVIKNKFKIDFINNEIPQQSNYNDISMSKEELILNNSVDIKDYNLKDTLKDKILFKSKGLQSILLDKLGTQNIKSNQSIFQSKLHPKISEYLQDFSDNVKMNEIFSIINSYYDLIITEPEELDLDEIRKVYIIHVINHVLKSIQGIKTEENKQQNELDEQNDKQQLEESQEIKVKEDLEQNIQTQRTQGYTRAKVLILTSNKQDCFEIVNTLINLFTKGVLKKTSNKQRFLKEYGSEEDAGNDDFRLGLQIAGKNIKLYSPFANSDIIIASPLGIRTITGAKGDEKREFSFLSSIEILVMDRAHSFLMQNWQNIEEIMPVLNQIPKHKDVLSDLNQIREYFFENQSKFFRQNIVLTEFMFPELNSIQKRFFSNYMGLIQNKIIYMPVSYKHPEVQKEFIKIECASHANEPQDRYDCFSSRLWTRVRNDKFMYKTVIFTANYFEFLKLKSFFKKVNAPVECISEYTQKNKKQSRLARFSNGHIHFLLFSERAYFLGVSEVKKMSNIVFYNIPKNLFIYQEIIEQIETQFQPEEDTPLDKRKVIALYTKYDSLALERILGTQQSRELLQEYNKNVTFYV